MRTALPLLGASLVLGITVAFSPWGFGGAEPFYEALTFGGITVSVVLWVISFLLRWQFTWRKCVVSLCLAALCSIGFYQIIPLPAALSGLSAAGSLRRQTLPETAEILPRQTQPLLAPAPAISLYPQQTRVEIANWLAVLAVFVMVRNLPLNPATLLRWLFIGLVINGVCLAVFAIGQSVSSKPNVIFWTIQTEGAVFGPYICRTHYAFYVNICIGAALGLFLEQMVASSRKRAAEWSESPPKTGEAAVTPSSTEGTAGASVEKPAEVGEERKKRRGRKKYKSEFDEAPVLFRAVSMVRNSWSSGVASVLGHPMALYLGAALALMVATIFMSLARGGVISLAVGSLVVLSYLGRRNPSAWLGGGVVLVLVLGVLSWFGIGAIEKRIETVTSGQALQSRIPLWTDSLPLVPGFFWVGSGYGTYGYVEQLHQSSMPANMFADHAHNEFLEAIIEGGIVRLLLTLLLIVLVFRAGWRAVRNHPDRQVRRLALGALFGFTTLVVQSIADFGIHLASIALLATVLAALLVSLGDPLPTFSGGGSGSVAGAERSEAPASLPQGDASISGKTGAERSEAPATPAAPQGEGEKGKRAGSRRRHRSHAGPVPEQGLVFAIAADDPRYYHLRFFGLAPLLGGAAILLLALLLGSEAWRRQHFEGLRDQARDLDKKKDLPSIEERIALLEKARRFAPDHARLNLETGRAYLDAYAHRIAEIDQSRAAAGYAQLILSANPLAAPPAALPPVALAPRLVGTPAWEKPFDPERAKANRAWLYPALLHFVHARDVCPLLAEPNIRIASYRPHFVKADPRSAYLARAKLLIANDPSLYFLIGVEEFIDGDRDQACASWRKSLERGEGFLKPILQIVKRSGKADELLNKAMPDRPDLLLASALLLFPDDEAENRVPLLERAVRLTEPKPGERLAGPMLVTRGRILVKLDRPREAELAYRQALAREPRQVDWLLELAVVLAEQGKYSESRTELHYLLTLQPQHAKAHELLNQVALKLARGH